MNTQRILTSTITCGLVAASVLTGASVASASPAPNTAASKGAQATSEALAITGPATKLYTPLATAVDSTGRIYVVNNNNTVNVYAKGATGNTAPIFQYTTASGLNQTGSISIDSSNNVYLSNKGHIDPDTGDVNDANIEVLPPLPQAAPASAPQPTRTIAMNKNMSVWTIAAQNDGTIVAGEEYTDHQYLDGVVNVYDPTGKQIGGIPPISIGGRAGFIQAVAVDNKGNVAVDDLTAGPSVAGPPELEEFTLDSLKTPNPAPFAAITGDATGLSGANANSAAFDASGDLITDATIVQSLGHQGSAVLKFSPGATGNVKPSSMFTSALFGDDNFSAGHLAVDAQGTLYVPSKASVSPTKTADAVVIFPNAVR